MSSPLTISKTTQQSEWKLLDCTIRDGGYYNEWDFDEPFVERYLDTMAAAGIDRVELGFWDPPGKEGGRGPYANYDAWVAEQAQERGLHVSVLANAKLWIGSDGFDAGLPADVGIRIAAAPGAADKALDLVSSMKHDRWRTLNVMQASRLTGEQVRALAQTAASVGIDCLYLADSYGACMPHEVREQVRIIVGAGVQAGFHAHDSLGAALANSIAALEAGASWIDGTCLGMGRGPGNARTEQALALRPASRSGLPEVMGFIHERMEPLQRHYGWGFGEVYQACALDGIHPSYGQSLASPRYSRMERARALVHLRSISESEKGGFKAQTLREALARRKGGGVPKVASVLIEGSAPSAQEHRHRINRWLDRNKDVRHWSLNGAHIRPGTTSVGLHTSEMDVCPENGPGFQLASAFSAHNSMIEAPSDDVLAYALGCALLAGTKKIWLAGIGDAEDHDWKRRTEQNEIISGFLNVSRSTEVRSLTRSHLASGGWHG